MNEFTDIKVTDLLEFIPITDMRFISRPRMIFQINVPTSVVIFEPQICAPTQARVYDTSRFLYNPINDPLNPCEMILGYKDLFKAEMERIGKFRGTGWENEIYLVEVWENHGEDGHVYYHHVGYKYVPKFTFNEEMKEAEPHSVRGKLPNCMVI